MQCFGFQIDQFDTHVHGSLTECTLGANGFVAREVVLIPNITFPREIFLYFVVKHVIMKEAIKKKKGFVGFDSIYASTVSPSKLKIGNEYKSDIEKYRKNYELNFEILAVDDDRAKVNLFTRGAWNYDFGQIIIAKDLLEYAIKQLNAAVFFPHVWTDISRKIMRIKPKIARSDLMRPYRAATENAFDLILNSPVTVLFSNVFRMLAPTMEGVIKDYIVLMAIRGIKTNTLSTIVGSLIGYNGLHFSGEFKEYLKMILEPVRNQSMHGGLPSEAVCNFLVVIILEMLDEMLAKAP